MSTKTKTILYVAGILAIMLVSTVFFPRYNPSRLSNTQTNSSTSSESTVSTTSEPLLPNNAATTIQSTITPEIIKENSTTSNITINAQVPQVVGSANVTQQDKVNSFLHDTITGIISNFKKSAKNQSSLDINYEMSYFSNGLLSAKLNITKSNNSLSGTSTTNSFIGLNYDIDNSKQIALEDVFNASSNYLSILSVLSAKDLLQFHAQDKNQADLVLCIQTVTAPNKANFNNFNFNESSFTLYTQAAKAGSLNCLGNEIIEIPCADLADYINVPGPVTKIFSIISL